MKAILNFLKKYPEIEEINKNILRNEGYLKSLKEDRIRNLYYKHSCNAWKWTLKTEKPPAMIDVCLRNAQKS